MKKRWFDEFARDLIAFGSIPFLILTIARVSVTNICYPMQFVVGSTFFFILNAFFKGEIRAGIGVVLLGFTSLYYSSWLFAIFALLVYTGLIISLFYLGRGKKEILKGILLGGLSTLTGYFAVKLIFFR